MLISNVFYCGGQYLGGRDEDKNSLLIFNTVQMIKSSGQSSMAF